MSGKLALLETLSNFGGNLTLKNRLALAPLTRARSGRSQVPNDANVEYYKQRSTSGLVISEGTIISEQGMGWAGAAAIYKPEHVEGWKKVTEAVHQADGVIFCQLWHMGRTTGSVFLGLQPVAPSAIAAEGRVTDYDGSKHSYEVPRALELDEIPGVVDQYRAAARNAKEAGFDGVEIHAANGYLVDTFLQSCSNKRSDAYGGSVDNRYRILGEIIEACKESFPSNRIGVRLSPNGAFGSMGSADNFDSYIEYLKKLNQLDLAYAHVMDGLGFGFHNLCKQLKLMDARKAYDGIIIGNVGYTRDTAEGAIGTGAVDMIAFGRPYISNPDLPQRFENNWPLNESDHTTYWNYPDFPEGNPNVGYTDYPYYEKKE
jgi:N-ethylmaleimide reductase